MIKKLIIKYKEIIYYLFFGLATTMLNAIIHFALSMGIGLYAWTAGAIANICAIIFAFIVNKIFVFEDKEKRAIGLLRQFALFAGARVAISACAVLIMLVFVDIMALNEAVFFVISQAFMIVLNYVISKWLVFKKAGKAGKD